MKVYQVRYEIEDNYYVVNTFVSESEAKLVETTLNTLSRLAEAVFFYVEPISLIPESELIDITDPSQLLGLFREDDWGVTSDIGDALENIADPEEGDREYEPEIVAFAKRYVEQEQERIAAIRTKQGVE